MSFKGFSKAITRAPQQFRTKFNVGEVTKDPIYLDAERRFKDLELQTKKLFEDSSKYAEAIHGMLRHQIGFAQAISEIYQPISGQLSDPTSIQDEGNQEGISASDEYQLMVKELEEELTPELELIQTRIIKPCEELISIVKLVRKMIVKRDHKQLDYDRRKNTLKKLQEKKNASQEDPAYYQAEAHFEEAAQEFDFYNDLLKNELPKLFELETEFIKPLFQSFYYMQLNIYWTLNQKCKHIQIPYFEIHSDLIEDFDRKRGDVFDQTEQLGICKGKFARAQISRTRSERRPSNAKSDFASRSIDSPRSIDAAPPYEPPSYSSTTMPSYKSYNNYNNNNNNNSNYSYTEKPANSSPFDMTEFRVALYDYTPQAEGDLEFRVGDKIEVVQKSESENDWWTGKLRGKVGIFPGNYTESSN